MDKEILKGSIDILILSLLNQEDMYGYIIAKSIKEKSDNLYEMGEGTLYPALKRMEAKDLIQSYWMESDSGTKRKYYKITDLGKKELKSKFEAWNSINNLIKLCYKGV